MIINELVSNALKHAFGEDHRGEVSVELQTDGELFRLVVSDTGVGVPEGTELTDPVTLGLKLVDTLTSQLHGRIELDREGGTKFTISRDQ